MARTPNRGSRRGNYRVRKAIGGLRWSAAFTAPRLDLGGIEYDSAGSSYRSIGVFSYIDRPRPPRCESVPRRLLPLPARRPNYVSEWVLVSSPRAAAWVRPAAARSSAVRELSGFLCYKVPDGETRILAMCAGYADEG